MRKRILTALALFIGPLAFASMVILFDPATGRNLRRIDSADTLAYLTRTDALINPVLPTNDLSACYITNGAVEVIPQAWLDAEALAASNAAALARANWKSNRLAAAKSIFDDNSNTLNLVVGAIALELWRMNNEFRTNAGMAARTKNWVLQSVVTNMQYLSTNQ